MHSRNSASGSYQQPSGSRSVYITASVSMERKYIAGKDTKAQKRRSRTSRMWGLCWKPALKIPDPPPGDPWHGRGVGEASWAAGGFPPNGLYARVRNPSLTLEIGFVDLKAIT